MRFDVDAVVIGSGAGGGTLAYKLVENGLRVLLVERGRRLLPRSAETGPTSRYLYHEVRDHAEPLSFVGGQTKFYGAALYRFRESDFEAVQHENGISPAWPIRYQDLAPYYDQAEHLYRVHGSPDGDPTEPPRSKPFPFPPLPQDPAVRKMSRALNRVGVATATIPRGLDYSADGLCVMCAACDAHHCERDAKMDAETAALAAASPSGLLRIVEGTECTRVLLDSSGTNAVGVALRDEAGDYVVECQLVAVCAGLPGSAMLLRRSHTAQHPNGLGNAGGALGRYLGGHATGMVFPLLGLRKIPAEHTKDFAINGFYHGGPDWAYPLGVIQTAGQTPFWTVASPVMRPVARAIGRRSITCFYMGEALPTRDSGLVFDGDAIARRELPAYNPQSFAKLRLIATALFRKAGYRSVARRRTPYLWHETGTACMGSDPTSSVTDAACQVHGIAGLHVVDASVLPSAGMVNTGLTIMALALRTGDVIAAKHRTLRKAA